VAHAHIRQLLSTSGRSTSLRAGAVVDDARPATDSFEETSSMHVIQQHTPATGTRVEDTRADAVPLHRRRALRLLTVIGAVTLAVTFAGQSAAQAAPRGGWGGHQRGAPQPAAAAPAPAAAPAATGTGTQAYKDYAAGKLGNATQMGCLDRLWTAESNWNPKAQNPTSTAYGIPQFLDSTWATTGIAKTSDPYRQVDAGLIYIHNRYGTPCSAWSFHQAHNWY